MGVYQLKFIISENTFFKTLNIEKFINLNIWNSTQQMQTIWIPYCSTKHVMSKYWIVCLMVVTVTEICSKIYIIEYTYCCVLTERQFSEYYNTTGWLI